MKTQRTKKGKPSQVKPAGNLLENEIDDLINREKVKTRIVGRLFNQPDSPIEKIKS